MPFWTHHKIDQSHLVGKGDILDVRAFFVEVDQFPGISILDHQFIAWGKIDTGWHF